MNLRTRLRFWLRSTFHRSNVEQEMESEIRFHIERYTEDLVRRGVALDVARRTAQAEFGAVEARKDECGDAIGLRLLHDLWDDVRYAFRTLRKAPAFTAVVVLTLALGIGANTAVFNVVNTVLFRPLPYPQSERLVQMWSTNANTNRWGIWTAYPRFTDWRRLATAFEEMAAVRLWIVNLSGGDHPEALTVVLASSRLFEVLRVSPMLGRAFLPEEDLPGHAHVIILSDGLWRRSFDSDPTVVGRRINVDRQTYTVIGVMPPGFRFPPNLSAAQSIDAWLPPAPDPSRDERVSNNYYVVARLRPGVTAAQAQTQMDAIHHGLAEKYSEDRELGVKVTGWQQQIGSDVRPALLILWGAISLVLLIACANVANLLLARGAARQREAAVRQALGAGRARLIRQLLTESVVLAFLGGTAGLGIAYLSLKVFIRSAPDIPRINETTMDWRVLLFSAALTLGTSVLFGIAPALFSSKADLRDALKESGGRLTAGSGRVRLRSVLIMAEMALALMLLTGACLLLQSFVHVQQVYPGFNAQKLLTAFVMLPPSKYPEPRNQALFFRDLMERVASIPGVEYAGGADSAPMLTNDTGPVSIEGHQSRPGENLIEAERPKITPDYFRAMGIHLLRGRAFTWADNDNSPPVAIVDETAARQYWPNASALGKRVRLDDGGPYVWRQVIGIVANVRQDGLVEPARPEVYAPMLQSPVPYIALTVRTRMEPAALTGAIRHAAVAVDKDQPLSHIQPMEQVVSDSIAGRRFQTALLALFSSVALMLAAVGIYGLMSYSVSQRTHEIGIRMALGAKRKTVLQLVLHQALLLAASGVAFGIGGALILTRLMSSLLFGVRPDDPLTFVTAAVLLVVVATAASLIPASRAARVDPLVALRHQ